MQHICHVKKVFNANSVVFLSGKCLNCVWLTTLSEILNGNKPLNFKLHNRSVSYMLTKFASNQNTTFCLIINLKTAYSAELRYR